MATPLCTRNQTNAPSGTSVEFEANASVAPSSHVRNISLLERIVPNVAVGGWLHPTKEVCVCLPAPRTAHEKERKGEGATVPAADFPLH